MSSTPFAKFPLVAATLAFALSGCSSTPSGPLSSSRPVTTLVVQQRAPVLADIDLQANGKSIGDLYVFDASITDSEGRKGALTGTLLVADLPDPRSGEVWESRLGDLNFVLDGDQLLVKGATVYPQAQREMAVNQPQVRAVIGGTGRYVGVGGEVSTVRNADGTYTPTFRLMR